MGIHKASKAENSKNQRDSQEKSSKSQYSKSGRVAWGARFEPEKQTLNYWKRVKQHHFENGT